MKNMFGLILISLILCFSKPNDDDDDDELPTYDDIGYSILIGMMQQIVLKLSCFYLFS